MLFAVAVMYTDTVYPRLGGASGRSKKLHTMGSSARQPWLATHVCLDSCIVRNLPWKSDREGNWKGRGATLTDFHYDLNKRRKNITICYTVLAFLQMVLTFCYAVEGKWILLNSYTCPTNLHTSLVSQAGMLTIFNLPYFLCISTCCTLGFTHCHTESRMLWGSFWRCAQLFLCKLFPTIPISGVFHAGWKPPSTFPSPHGSEFANDHV